MGLRDAVRSPQVGFALLFMFVFYLLLIAVLQASFSLSTAGGGNSSMDGFFQDRLGAILGLGLMSLAFLGIAVPLVSMRERGLLRLFGTTPLRRSTLLLSLAPFLVIVGLVEVTVVVVIALVNGYLAAPSLGSLMVSSLLGLLMLIAFGLLFGSRAGHAESVQSVMALLPMLLIAVVQGLFPLPPLPGWVQWGINMLPSTWLIDALNADITGVQPSMPLQVLWSLMAAMAVMVFVLAVAVFRWDQGDSVGRATSPQPIEFPERE